MTKVGRKTKLTPELQEQIVKYIEAGNFAKDACQAAGIGETTFYKWLKKGKEGIEPFREFQESIKKARAKSIIRNTLVIKTAAKNSWQAAACWLERVSHKDWGKKAMYGEIEDSPIKIEIKNKDLEKELMDNLNAMAERLNKSKEKKNIKKRK